MLNSLIQFLLGMIMFFLISETHSYITEGYGINPLLSLGVAVAITIAAICSQQKLANDPNL